MDGQAARRPGLGHHAGLTGPVRSSGRIPVPGAHAAAGLGVSASGWLVGAAYNGPVAQSFVRAPDGAVTIVGPTDGDDGDTTDLVAIDDQGTAVGFERRRGSERPVRWTPDGVLLALAATAGSAVAINGSGVAVGWLDSDRGARPVAWAVDGTMTELAAPGPARAVAINDAGDILGHLPDGVVVWDGGAGVPRQLRSVVPPADSFAFADGLHAMNDAGDIVGVAAGPSGPRAALWPGGGAAVHLAGGDGPSVARAVSEDGAVVGHVEIDGQRHAAYWSPGDHRFHDLGLADGDETMAYGIALDGTIVGVVMVPIEHFPVPQVVVFDEPPRP